MYRGRIRIQEIRYIQCKPNNKNKHKKSMKLLIIIKKFQDFSEDSSKKEMKSLSTVKEWHLEHCGLAIPEVSHVLGCAKKKKKMQYQEINQETFHQHYLTEKMSLMHF